VAVEADFLVVQSSSQTMAHLTFCIDFPLDKFTSKIKPIFSCFYVWRTSIILFIDFWANYNGSETCCGQFWLRRSALYIFSFHWAHQRSPSSYSRQHIMVLSDFSDFLNVQEHPIKPIWFMAPWYVTFHGPGNAFQSTSLMGFTFVIKMAHMIAIFLKPNMRAWIWR
jgi:hypothetical protein